jgi:cell division protein FtsB
VTRSYRPNPRYVFRVPGTGRIWWSVLTGLGIVIILVLLMAGEKSLFKVIALYREQEHLIAQIEEMKGQNEKLGQQIEDLKTDPKAVERIAREELGMVRKDETVYRFVSPELAKDPRD